jgi:hypothetical protein
VPYQFEIKSNLSNILPIPITPVIVNPPQVNPIKPLPVAIVPPPKIVTPVVSPVAPPSVQPPSVPVKIPTQAPLIPASVKMEVDNSSIIVIGVLAVAFLFLKK